MTTHNPPIAAFIADTHLSSSGSAWAGSVIRGDAEAAVRFFAEYCAKNKIPGFGAGDLFDRSLNRSAVLEIATRALQPFTESGLTFYYIKGNHDPDSPPWLTFVSGTHYIDNTLVELGNDYAVYGLDYRSAVDLPDALQGIPQEATILLAHQAWSEWNKNPGAAQGSLVDVPHVTYVISGDDHVSRSDVLTGSTGNRFLAVSPGSSSLQAIGEAPDKYFCVLLADGTVEFVDIPSRPVFVSEIMEDSEEVFQWFSRVAELAEEAVQAEKQRCHVEEIPFKPLARVFYRQPAVPQVRLMMKRYSSVAHFFPKSFSIKRDDALDGIVEIPEGPVVGPRELLSQIYVTASIEYGIADRMLAEVDAEGDLVLAAKREIDMLSQLMEQADEAENVSA